MPMSAIEYYHARVDKPVNASQVLTESSLKAFLGSDPIAPIHMIFTTRVVKILAMINAEQAAERRSLTAAIQERELLEEHLKDVKSRERILGWMMSKAHKRERFWEAKSAGTECAIPTRLTVER